MRLYQTPGGTWTKSEKDWATAMKAEGLDPKKHNGRKIVEVPVVQAGLMEFLTFHNVNAVNPRNGEVTGGGRTPTPPLPPPVSSPTPIDLDAAFAAAPLSHRLRLAVTAIDAADTVVRQQS